MSNRKSSLDAAVDFALDQLNKQGAINRLPQTLQTVLRIHAAQGVLDNGGLQYFFESDWDGHSRYSVFADAYREIGAWEEAAALEKAASFFDFPNPEQHADRREAVLDRLHSDDEGGEFWEYDHFLCGNENVWRCLAAYADRNREHFS
jgi:hypothetical protein